MDCKKTGELICLLRKQKNLTQKQLAQLVGVSNKTVSKWECGHGLPDILTVEKLARVFNTTTSCLLEGEIKQNKTDVGKLEKTKFYICPVCNNIITSTSKADVFCCDKKLFPLCSSFCDDKHQTHAEHIDTDLFLTINHPMTKDHFITFVACVFDDHIILYRLYPEQNAEVRIPFSKRNFHLYFCCSQDGFFRIKNI